MNQNYQHFKTRLLPNGVLLIGFDTKDKKVNVLNTETVGELTSVVNSALEDTKVKGVVLASLKQGCFIAGADISEIAAMTDKEVCKALVMKVHNLFLKMEESPKAFVAAIEGVCLGGGFELALACDWRVASDNPKTSLALPEVKLGIIPGFGGTQRLPRLVGLPAALEAITSGKTFYAVPALKRGMLDDVVSHIKFEKTIDALDKEPFIQQAVKRALSGKRNFALQKFPLMTKILGMPIVRDYVTLKKARQMIMKQTKGNYPAPLAAVDAVERGLELQGKGLRPYVEAELPILLDLVVSPLSKDLIGIFFSTERAKSREIGPPMPVDRKQTLGVLGAGLMGSQIAGVLVDKGFDVKMKDVKPEFLCPGMDRIFKMELKDLKKKIIKKPELEQRLLRIEPVTNWDGFDRIQYVIESILEDLAVKQQALAEWEAIAPKDAIFASNTSSFPLSKIAEKAKNKERVVGMHFFNPVRQMQLVEIIKAEATSDETVLKAYNLAKSLGKIPIVVKECPGFVVNRILARYLAESILLLAEGISVEDIDRAAKKFGMAIDSGHAMGPLELCDYIGIKTAVLVLNSLKALGERVEGHPLVTEMLPKDKKPLTFWSEGKGNPAVYEILKSKYGWQPKTLSQEEITKRLMLPMADEALRCLQEGVVEKPWQINLAMMYGAGFPAFRAGLLNWLARRGLEKTRQDLEEMSVKYGKRFAPCSFYKEAEQVLEKLM